MNMHWFPAFNLVRHIAAERLHGRMGVSDVTRNMNPQPGGLAESRGLTHNFRPCCAVENRSAVMSESQLWGASYLLP